VGILVLLVICSDAFDLEYGVGILRLKEGLYCETDANETLNEDNSIHHKPDPEGRWTDEVMDIVQV
jgi:hypothetical protein